ncbi:hypothetical protein ACFMPD_09065 [Sedimentitalea sp. HM32M-2]|uniref:hypothetical protein n=1 Tax=Sedimentitalea sp. HM32M-2 TaxID=3351566 RepID=UPI00363E2446
MAPPPRNLLEAVSLARCLAHAFDVDKPEPGSFHSSLPVSNAGGCSSGRSPNKPSMTIAIQSWMFWRVNRKKEDDPEKTEYQPLGSALGNAHIARHSKGRTMGFNVGSI